MTQRDILEVNGALFVTALEKGGVGSGNYGHSGRIGERGGSGGGSLGGGGGKVSRKAILERLEIDYAKPGPMTEQMSNDFKTAKDVAMTDAGKGQFGTASETLSSLSNAQKIHGLDGSARSNSRLAARFERLEEKVKEDVKAKRVENTEEARAYYVNELRQDTDFMAGYGDYFKE